jgi:hypothetical protein
MQQNIILVFSEYLINNSKKMKHVKEFENGGKTLIFEAIYG